jgi:hypothetical protein
MDNLQIKIKERLEKITEMIISESQQELDLALAMDDRATIFRMQAKLEALRESMELFEQAMQADHLEAFKAAFDTVMLVRKQRLEDAISKFRVEKNSQQIIYHQIHLSVTEGPIEGTVNAIYKRVKEDACQA